MRRSFTRYIIDGRVEAYVKDAFERIVQEADESYIMDGRAGLFVMFTKGVLMASIGWTNDKIRLRNLGHKEISMYSFYGFIAVLPWYQMKNMSTARSIATFRELRYNTPSTEDVTFIANNISGFHPSLSLNIWHGFWMA